MKPLLAALLLLSLSGCKKEPPKYCWERIDQFGNLLNIVCDKTEAEIEALYPDRCSYYKSGGEKFCWLINGRFLQSMTQDGVEKVSSCFNFGPGVPAKVNCDYCQQWYHREKKLYKPTNSFAYSQITTERFCGDTAKTLFQGRQIIKKDTPDSLIIIQFSNNGTTW